ncbi:MAG: hypothetical protein EZS28_022597, partial [Streblomastix strix]
MDYIHVIYGDTDSLCLAIAHESWPIKDKKLWDQLYSQLFPSASDDNQYDKKKILVWNIESESIICLELAPKQHFKKLHGKSPDKIQDIPPDYQIKLLSRLSCPYFSPKLGSWEIGLVFSMDERIIRANQIYLFCININTKYLVVFPLRDISAGQIMNALQILVKYYHVTNIRGDGEKGFNGTILKSFCQEHKITSFFTDSKFTKHNRVVDSVIRTIRNAFVDDSQKFADNDLMQYIVKMYNQTPHSAYDNKYSPQQVNDNQDIEGQYIRQQQDKLFEIKQQQQSKGLLSFQPRNILMIHLDYSKTSYQNIAIVPKAQKGKWQFSVPVKSPEEQLQIFADNISKLKSPGEQLQIPNLKLRKRKHAIEEDAKQAQRIKKKISRAKDKQRALEYK